MSEIAATYELTVMSWGALALLMMIQLLTADIMGIRHRHIPGTPVEASHHNPLFRATRAVANTNESIAIYLLLVLFCIFSGADAGYLAAASWGYIASRAAYAACYYFNQQTLRSVCFGLSLVALLGMLIVGAIA